MKNNKIFEEIKKGLNFNYYDDNVLNINTFLGKTFKNIVINDDKNEILFLDLEGNGYLMFHIQECCEEVFIDDIVGDIEDLINSPITMAEEVTNKGEDVEEDLSLTWTFYKLATIKGYVNIKWYGVSNGYYSENVNIIPNN